MASFPLVKLPTELLAEVASHLKTEDLGHLRLASKIIEQRLFNFFASEFFTTRQFSLALVASVECLVGISQHAQLRQYVKKLIIGLDAIQSPRFDSSAEESQRYTKYKETAGWMFESGEAAAQLALALRNLPNCLDIEIRDFESMRRRLRDRTSWRSYGIKAAERDENVCFNFAGTQLETVFGVVTHAIAQSQIKVASLSDICRFPNRSSAIQSMAPFAIPAYARPRFANAFGSLKTLMLTLQSPLMYMLYGSEWEPLKGFFEIAPNLEHLRLNITGSPEQFPASVLEIVSSTYSNGKLRRVDLGKCAVEALNLVKFIEALSHSLEHLCLNLMIIMGTNGGETFLSHLKQLAQKGKLREVFFRNLASPEGEFRFKDNVGQKIESNQDWVSHTKQQVGIKLTRQNERMEDLLEDLHQRMICRKRNVMLDPGIDSDGQDDDDEDEDEDDEDEDEDEDEDADEDVAGEQS